MLLVFLLQNWMGDGEHCWLATEIPQAERHAVRQSGGKASSMKDKLRRPWPSPPLPPYLLP